MSLGSVAKPIIFLIPGVCHTPVHFSTLVHHLNTSGYRTVTVSLPSVDSRSPFEESCAKDGIHVRSELEAVLDAGKDVVLVAHSYGGLPGSGAAKGFMKSEREAAGKKGGIIGQVFIAAFLAPEGVSLVQAFGGSHASWVISTSNNAKSVFFADAEEEIANAVAKELKPSAVACVETPSPASGLGNSAVEGKRVYVICTEDAAVPPQAQEMIVRGTGLDWI